MFHADILPGFRSRRGITGPTTIVDRQRRRLGGAGSGNIQDMVFKRVGDGRPYPDHGLTSREWAAIRPTRVRLSTLVTTKSQLDLSALLDDDSTYYGDLFAHIIEWRGELYLEDGLHRALRAALATRGDALLHARIHVMDHDEPSHRTPGTSPG